MITVLMLCLLAIIVYALIRFLKEQKVEDIKTKILFDGVWVRDNGTYLIDTNGREYKLTKMQLINLPDIGEEISILGYRKRNGECVVFAMPDLYKERKVE